MWSSGAAATPGKLESILQGCYTDEPKPRHCLIFDKVGMLFLERHEDTLVVFLHSKLALAASTWINIHSYSPFLYLNRDLTYNYRVEGMKDG